MVNHPHRSKRPKWRELATPPISTCGVLLWFPLGHAVDDQGRPVELVIGQDYRIQIGWWNGKHFLEQGTSHDVLIEADGDARATPTHWMPLPPPPEAS